MWLDNMSMVKKLIIAPGVLIIILLGVTITSSTLLNGLSSDMERISFDLAPDTELAAEMTDTVYSLRMAMKNYVQTSDEQYVNVFSDHAKDWTDSLMPKAYDSIQDKRRIVLLKEIDELRDDYITTFESGVVRNMRTRNSLVDAMNANGPIIEKNLTDIVEASADNNIEVALHAGKAARNLIRARLHVMKFLVDNTPEQVKNYTEELEITENELTHLMSELSPAQKRLANSTLDLIKEYQLASKQVSEAIYKRNESIKQLDSIGPKIAQHINDLRKSIANSMEEAAKEAQADTDSATTSLFIAATIAAAIGILVTFLIARAVSAKLKATNAVLADIADGDGDLTIRIPENGSDELAQIARNYNTFANKLKSTVAELSSASQTMLASSQTLSDKAIITQREITEQQAQAEQAASAMTEMAASAQEINYSATEAEELAHSTSTAASQGATVISEASGAMQTLSTQIQGASITVEELKADSDKIGQVLNVIISIAEQTNLLALNAAIEAARAGEQGRGFAVVADEVRSLASRTQDSTEEIKVIIESLQKSSEEANKAMLISRDNADQTVAKVESANEALSAIDNYITQIASAISQISTAAGEQATVSSEVSERVTSMSDISTKTLSESKETTTSAEQLKSVGQKVNGLLQQFKI